MGALRSQDRSTYSRPPAGLRSSDVGREVRLEPKRACGSCGHYTDVARVVRLSDSSYAYACLGCAVRFDDRREGDDPSPTPPRPAATTPNEVAPHDRVKAGETPTPAGSLQDRPR